MNVATLALAVITGAAALAPAQAQNYPVRPVRIIVPLTPGRTEPALDKAQALADLNIASTVLAELMHEARHLPDVLPPLGTAVLTRAHLESNSRATGPSRQGALRRRGRHGLAESCAHREPGRRAVPPRI